MIPEEYARAANAVVADERVQRALAARGVTDMSLVQVDVLPSGVFGHRRGATAMARRPPTAWCPATARRRCSHSAAPASTAGFARHTLWVTPHDPAQRHPAGSYPSIMPMNKAGFALEPVGFFDRNPTLDLPPASRCPP
jgi:Cu2+-containing amine oxidase